MKLWPFFTYFGGKWRAAPHYSDPLEGVSIIEPFAGSAGYAIRHGAFRHVVLAEKDTTVRTLWQYLITARKERILSLPDVLPGDHLDGPKFASLEPEERALIGFWLNKGMTAPCKTPSAWMRQGWRPDSQWGPAIRQRIANQLSAIQHWEVLASYEDCPDVEATWFIDPPYEGRAGERYREHGIDYAKLAEWCKSRKGRVMVCENEGASWLPFERFRVIKGTEGRKRSGKSHEALWRRDT